jgi:hypothetical protein
MLFSHYPGSCFRFTCFGFGLLFACLLLFAGIWYTTSKLILVTINLDFMPYNVGWGIELVCITLRLRTKARRGLCTQAIHELASSFNKAKFNKDCSRFNARALPLGCATEYTV